MLKVNDIGMRTVKKYDFLKIGIVIIKKNVYNI